MKRAFTLVELLTVVAIMAILMAMALSMPKQDRRRTAVEAASRELAGTLRLARSLAMERRTAYAVAFNIANGAGTSGRILNNWGGGHWYQILGPNEDTLARNAPGWHHTLPVLTNAGSQSVSVVQVLDGINRTWIGQRTVLQPRQVRFLSLGDQDNGIVRLWYRDDIQEMRSFPATYPRPWCGWWEASTGMLHGWGGYDSRVSGGQPVVRDFWNRNCSGFNFEGWSGTVSGCVNATTRTSTIDGRVLLRAGEPRALVNADWLDSYITFRPDGTAQFGHFGRLRQMSYQFRGAAGVTGAATGWGDIGDFLPILSETDWWWSNTDRIVDHDSQQAGHFLRRTGYWHLTLAPDAESDSNEFPDARSAQRSMMPAYRVAVSPSGEIKVTPVKSFLPSGAVLDTSIAPGDWTNHTVTSARYQRNLLTESDGSDRGRPVTDAITPEMLAQRSWWFAP